MLLSLSIRDVVLIDKLDLSFLPGLCVLTGETGAGKSILLDSLGLALGARSDSGLVRPGAEQASVAAAFEVSADHPAAQLLGEQEFGGDGSIVLRRILSTDGRTRAFINDQPASVGLLRRLGDLLVEIQGHFDQQGLLDTANHRVVLDGFGNNGKSIDACRAAYRSWREAQTALAKAEQEAVEARADEDFLRHALDELDALAPEEGEERSLAERRHALMHREKLIAALGEANADLTGQPPVEDALRVAEARLAKVAEFAGGAFDPLTEALQRAALDVTEAIRLLGALAAGFDDEPGQLDAMEERLFSLRDIARKHRTEVDALPALREDIAAKLASIHDRGDEISRLGDLLDSARATYIAAAASLTRRRGTMAKKLDKAVAAELPPLKLEKARFETALEPLDEAEWSENGVERVSFQVATNPGAALGPIGRIASAGELSRFMLALKVVATGLSTLPTLIFDEVDSGIGGATAAAVGERLARLGRDVQVLVVTHSPQVAARGAHHWRVQKAGTGTGKAFVTQVDELREPARREEIARMLSGAEITDEARAAADSLIGGAGP
jgi:DNA repair protein RecN (Recombination protein N)